MGFESDLLAGVATLLEAAGVGSWSPSAALSSGATAITLGKLPTNVDAAVSLALYPVTDDPSLSDSVLGLQVMSRTAPGDDPRPHLDLSAAVFDQLHGLHDTDLSTGVRVVEAERRSGASLGQDDLKRWMRSDNYYVTVHRPSLNRQ